MNCIGSPLMRDSIIESTCGVSQYQGGEVTSRLVAKVEEFAAAVAVFNSAGTCAGGLHRLKQAINSN